MVKSVNGAMWHRAILPPAPPSLELIQIREIWEYCEMSSVTPIQPSPLEIVEICKIWWQFSVFVFLPWFEYWIPYPDIFNHQIQIFVPDYEGYANPWDCTDNPCKWCETICRIRDAYKKKIAHILSHWDNWKLPPPPTLCLKNLQKWAIFFPENLKKSLIFWLIWDNSIFATLPPPLSSKENQCPFYAMDFWIICVHSDFLIKGHT